MKLRLDYGAGNVGSDFYGGLTAAVVVLPVALAFGVASGMGPEVGVIGAVALGLFAAMFGGCQTQISCPSAPISVVIAVLFAREGDSGEIFAIAIVAGAMQIVLGWQRLGKYVVYTPYSVISGFLTGTGVLLLFMQSLPFVGLPIADGGGAALDTIKAWPDAIGDINNQSLIIGLVTLLIYIFWPAKFDGVVPAILAALIGGTLLSILALDDTPLIGDLSLAPSDFIGFSWPGLSFRLLDEVVLVALTVALLGSIDSLFTALSADIHTRTSHNPNRELIGQGIGNMMAGLLGGIPGAGTSMGTTPNIRAGGRTRISGVVSALLLLILIVAAGSFVERIPHAALAGILMKVGWDIMDWRFLKSIRAVQREHLLVMIITFGLTVFADLVIAVLVGMVIAAMARARDQEKLELNNVVSVPILDHVFFGDKVDLSDPDFDIHSAQVGMVVFRGTFSVASSNKMINTVGVDIRDHKLVIFDFSETISMDDSAAMVLEQLVDTAVAEDTECVVVGLRGDVAASLNSLDVLRGVPANRMVETLDDARRLARDILVGDPGLAPPELDVGASSGDPDASVGEEGEGLLD